MKVKFKSLSSQAKIPQKAIIGSACDNLFAAKSVVLEPNATRLVKTDLGFCFLKKYVAKIFPISSLSLQSIHVEWGIFYADYRGKFVSSLQTYLTIDLNFMLEIGLPRYFFRQKWTLFLKEFWVLLMIIRPKEALVVLPLHAFNGKKYYIFLAENVFSSIICWLWSKTRKNYPSWRCEVMELV